MIMGTLDVDTCASLMSITSTTVTSSPPVSAHGASQSIST